MDNRPSDKAIRFTAKLHVFCASVNVVRNEAFCYALFRFLSPGMVKSCYRRAALSTRDHPPGCQLHSCECLRFGIASDFGSLLRVVFDAVALFVSSFVFLLS